MSIIKHLNIPKTPVFISLILGIYEYGQDRSLINKASLIEEFIAILLGNNSKLEFKYKDIDRKDKENYLSIVAQNMVENQSQHIDSMVSLEEITVKYFRNRKLDVSISPFINYFFQQGILVQIDGKVFFRFDCFYEYFISKRMMNDKHFYQHIVSEENYLAFTNSIDYYSGLKRNSMELLQVINGRANEFAEKHGYSSIDMLFYDNLKDQLVSLNQDDNEKILKLRSKLSTKEKDLILDSENIIQDIDHDEVEILQNENREKIPGKIDCELPEETKEIKKEMDNLLVFTKILILLSRLLRNGDHIEDLEKRQLILNNCFELWARLLIKLTKFHTENIDNLKDIDDEQKDELKKFSHLSIPLIFQSILFENIGSEKLKGLFIESAICLKDIPIQYLILFTYSDLNLSNHLHKIKNFIKNSNIYFLDICLSKLYYKYIFEKHKNNELKLMEEIIAEIYFLKQCGKYNRKRINVSAMKQKYKQEIHKTKSKYNKQGGL